MDHNFDSKIWKISRLEQSFIITLSLIFFTIASSFVVKIFAEQKLDAVIERINQQPKVAINIEKKRFDFENFAIGSIDLKNIKVRFLDSQFSTTGLSVKISLNPFSDEFGTITQIQFGKTTINSNLADIKSLTPQSIRSKITQLNLQEKKQGAVSKTDNIIKKSLLFFSPNLTVTALLNHVSIKGLELNYPVDLKRGKLRFQRNTNTLILDSKNLNGQVQLIGLNKVNYRISSDSKGDLAWSQKGLLHLKENDYLTASISGKGFPHLIQEFVQSGNKNSHYNLQATVIPRPDRFTQLKGEFSFSELAIKHSLLANKALSSLASTIQFNTFFDLNKKEFVIKKAVLELANNSSNPTKNKKRGMKLAISAKGVFSDSHSPYGVWNGFVKSPNTTCQRAIDSIPDSFMPAKKGFLLSGSLGLEGEFRFNSANPDRFFFQQSKKSFFGCQVLKSPFEYSANRLGRPFFFKRKESDGSEISFNISPSSKFFTPIISINRSTTTAIVASEDAGFWHHKGFEIGAIESALRTNLKKNKVAVGGSTITMQTVKNLFLTSKRTMSRKAQEIFLAWHLEKILPKDRILEIYLNIIEFGPKIYGIAHASHHFFNKTPKTLGLKESAFLASVLPSPIKRYQQFCRGGLSQKYEMLMDKKLDQIHALGQISFKTYLKTRATPLVFVNSQRTSAGRCRKVIAGLAKPIGSAPPM